MDKIDKLVVCGVGLIGGSVALALRRARLVNRIVGVGRRPEPLAMARQLGVIDEIATDWADALNGASMVLLAMPVGQMDAVAAAIAPHLAPGTIVTIPRQMVNIIVTEYGWISLKGDSTWVRAEKLIGIAHPDFREELIKNAEEQKIWRRSNRIA